MRKTILRSLVFLLSLSAIVFSCGKLYGVYTEYKKGENAYQALADRYAAPPAAVPPSPTETTPAEPGETAPISVSFEALQAECRDVVAWLYCEGTSINYPVVQGPDNTWYLHRLLDGTYNINGTLFLDHANSPDFSDWNSILYGHNMKNGAMFGILQKYKSQAFFEEHPVWYLLTPDRDYKIELIGGYTTSSASDTYAIPGSTQERDRLIEKARQNTTFQAEAAVGAQERIVTLSTCAYEYDSARYVLAGVLHELSPSFPPKF